MPRPDLQPYGHASPAPDAPGVRSWLPRYAQITLCCLWCLYAAGMVLLGNPVDGEMAYPALYLVPALALLAICGCYLLIPKPRHWSYGAQIVLALLFGVLLWWTEARRPPPAPRPPPLPVIPTGNAQ